MKQTTKLKISVRLLSINSFRTKVRKLLSCDYKPKLKNMTQIILTLVAVILIYAATKLADN